MALLADPILSHVYFLLLIPFLSLNFQLAQTNRMELPNFQPAQTNRIELPSFLLASNESSPWRSSNGDFAFGFLLLEDQQQLFLLAIWFDKIPEKTVVWYANGDKLAPKGSKLELTSRGRFILRDPKGNVIWKAKTTINGNVDYAEMLDTGNFVLAITGSNIYKWESFNHPTDTVLPNQALKNGDRLTSREMQNNYSRGRFQLHIRPDGSLVLYTISPESAYEYQPYYNSRTYDRLNKKNSSQRLEFGYQGNLYIIGNFGIVSNFTVINTVQYPIKDFYYRATLDFDGYFRQYVYPKSAQSNGSSSTTQSWIRIWFIPQDICTNSVGQSGGGSCGFNSFCVSKDGWPTCKCLPGFPESAENGCIQEKVHNCELGGLKPEQVYDMVTLDNTYWPTSANYDVVQPTNEENCSRSCLNDCNCVVAVIRGQKCSKKKLPLSNGCVDTTVDGKALIKIAKSGNLDKQIITVDKSYKIPGGSIMLGISACLNILLIMAALIFFFFLHRKRGKHSTKSSKISETNLHSFTYDELKRATNEFKEELGRGAFGTVYKGVVSSSMKSAIAIAVKKLDKVVEEGEKEFKAEVNSIGKTHHKNLVRLIGFCDEGPNKLLIYDLMSNGSLANFLFQSLNKPDWNLRIQIANGIARGLLYLHEECGSKIIHCDIKPQNILLDNSFTAKISDFGLAKLLMFGQSRTQTGLKGTKGYVAPERFRNKPITEKVDVFSYGVMLMEIICCRKCIEKETEDDEEEVLYLVDLVYDCYRDRRLELLVEDDEEAKNDMEKVEMLVKVSIWCIQEDPCLRPSMRMVGQIIEGVLPVSDPPCPFSSTSIS